MVRLLLVGRSKHAQQHPVVGVKQVTAVGLGESSRYGPAKLGLDHLGLEQAYL